MSKHPPMGHVTQDPLQKVLMGTFARQQQLCAKHDVPPTLAGMALLRIVAKALMVSGIPAEAITQQVANGMMEGQAEISKVTPPTPPMAS